MPLVTDIDLSKLDDGAVLNPFDNPELGLCPTDGGLTDSNPLFIEFRSNSLGDNGFGILIRLPTPRFCCTPELELKLGDNLV